MAVSKAAFTKLANFLETFGSPNLLGIVLKS